MINKNEKKFLKKKLPMTIKMVSSLSLVVGAMGIAPYGLAADAKTKDIVEEVVVTGQRASIQSAQDIKKNSEVVVDSIQAEDIGKLPDRSVTDALQRVPGVTVNRYESMGDPEHFSGEGSGVAIRGLTQVRSELNGRDIFSAASGRGISFEDVPAELMAGVDVFKSPSADMIEGGLGGAVNLRTRMPFDNVGTVGGITLKANYGDQIKETNGEYSGLYSTRWDTDAGEFGVLVDFSTSQLSSRADNLYTRAFMPRDDLNTDETVYVPKGADWRRNDFHRARDGQYAALQWAPSDEVELYATAFSSQHYSTWDENGFFMDQYAGVWAPQPVTGANDWVFDDKNALVSGTMTTASDQNGIAFGTSTRKSETVTKTTDYSVGGKWSPDDHWKFNADLQYVNSSLKKEDNTLGLIVFPNKVAYTNLDGADGDAVGISVDSSYLSDYKNYSYGQKMTSPEMNDADEVAFHIDGEYSFDDSIIKSIKAGARFTEKTAVNHKPIDGTWTANYQAWQVNEASWAPYHNATQLPKVGAIPAGATLTVKSFENFQRGTASVPVAAVMYQSALLDDFKRATAYLEDYSPGGASKFDWSKLDLGSDDNTNKQQESTSAVYFMAKFDLFEDAAMPVDGNLGVRIVETDNSAHGKRSYGSFTLTDDPATTVVEKIQPFARDAESIESKNSYTNVLPSLNLRLKATDELFFRFAASQAIWAPSFADLRDHEPTKVDLAQGVTAPIANSVEAQNIPEKDLVRRIDMYENAYLEPMKANQFDLTAEWYFDDRGGNAHIALFKKDVSDFFRESDSTFVMEGTGDSRFDGKTYTTSRLENVGTADIHGFEVGFSKFFDSLPSPFDGLGVEMNYTRVDSSTHINTSVTKNGKVVTGGPIDTDENTAYGDLPMEGLSKDAYNLVAMFEKNGISARLAWNWRSRYLTSTNANGWKDEATNAAGQKYNWHIPVYNDDYGQLDASIGYTFKENYTVTLEGSNILKADTIGIMQQLNAGEHIAYVYSQDVRYALSLRAKF